MVRVCKEINNKIKISKCLEKSSEAFNHTELECDQTIQKWCKNGRKDMQR